MSQTALYGKRDNSLDRVAGLFILYVIFGHMNNWTVGSWAPERMFLEKLMPYFMPWFYFKSGMFFKSGLETREVARKGWKTLVVPFLVFGGLGIVLQAVKWHVFGDMTLEGAWNFQIRRIFLMGSFEGSNPLWFLLSLFFVKVIFNYLRNKNIPIGVILGACVTFVMANWLMKVELGPKSPAMAVLEYPRYLYNVPCGMIFYCCGILLKEKQYDWKFWIPALLVFVAVSFFRKNGARVSFMHNVPSSNCDYLMFLAASVGMCISYNVLFKYITKLCDKVTSFSPLAYLGRNSIAVYALHWPIMMIVWMIICGTGLMPDSSVPEVKALVRTDPELRAVLWKETAIYAAVCLPLIPVLNELILHSRLSWILGKKRVEKQQR